MKRKSRLTLFLVALMTLALMTSAGATSPGEAIIASQDAFANVSSYTMTMDLALSMAVGEESADIVLRGDVNAFVDPVRVKTEMTMEMMGMTIDMQQYIEPDETGAMVVYTHTGFGDMDMGWTKEVAPDPSSAMGQYDMQAALDIYAEIADSFVADGEEVIRGAQTTKYSGAISGKEIGDLAQGALSALDMGDTSSLAGSLEGDIPLSIWIDNESGAPVRYSMDMAEIMASAMGTAAEITGDAEATGIAINNCLMIMDITGVDNAEDFTVPEEALSASSALDQIAE